LILNFLPHCSGDQEI